MNLDEEKKARYKVLLSREDWKRILLGINNQLKLAILFIIAFMFVISYFSWLFLYSWFSHFFDSFRLINFSIPLLVLIWFILLLYFTSVEKALKPFKLREMEIDVVEKKIYLKNKTFSFKDMDTLVFYLEKNREKDKKNTSKSNNIGEKEKPTNKWVYYVKKKPFHRHSNEELGEQGVLDNYFEDFIIPPVEIKYLEDFNLVLGKEGLLGVWRQIAELLGVSFEKNIEFEDEILLQPKGNNFSFKKDNDFSIKEESPFSDEKEEAERKMRDFLNLLREKVEGNEASGANSLSSVDFEEFVLFEDELMGVKMLSTGFELRFWDDSTVFPHVEQIINNKFVIKELIRGLLFGLVVLISTFTTASLIDDTVLKKGLYLSGVFGCIYVIAMWFRIRIENIRSKDFLLRTAYLLEYFNLFMIAVTLVFVGLFENSPAFKILYSFAGLSGCLFVLFVILSDLQSSSCPWDLKINRYASRLVFSFEGNVLEGEHGFCVSRTHWQAPISKIQSLAVLRKKYSFWTCEFLLAIRIDEDYVLMPLPCFSKVEIREILFFLQEIFNMLL